VAALVVQGAEAVVLGMMMNFIVLEINDSRELFASIYFDVCFSKATM
jgi:hypothetical protein